LILTDTLLTPEYEDKIKNLMLKLRRKDAQEKFWNFEDLNAGV